MAQAPFLFLGVFLKNNTAATATTRMNADRGDAVAAGVTADNADKDDDDDDDDDGDDDDDNDNDTLQQKKAM